MFATEPTCSSLSPSGSSQFWYEAITHNGQSSFMDSSYKANYKVFRNVVTDYGADNTGTKDASSAIQSAITGMSLHEMIYRRFALIYP
jgi:glucan 1,3-beta-glucosidase